MRKAAKNLAVQRDTIRALTNVQLDDANGGEPILSIEKCQTRASVDVCTGTCPGSNGINGCGPGGPGPN
jgi:hypothetical protein